MSYVKPAYDKVMKAKGSLAKEITEAEDRLLHHRSKRNAMELIGRALNTSLQAADGKTKELRNPSRFLKFAADEVKKLQATKNDNPAQIKLAENKVTEAKQMSKLSKEESKAITRQIIRHKETFRAYMKELTDKLDSEKRKEGEYKKIQDQNMLKAIQEFKAELGK